MEYDDKRPVELCLELSERCQAAAAGARVQPHHRNPGAEFVLELLANNPTPNRHIVVQWNPGGHEPPCMYDLPHFDFTFFTSDSGACDHRADPEHRDQRPAECSSLR